MCNTKQDCDRIYHWANQKNPSCSGSGMTVQKPFPMIANWL